MKRDPRSFGRKPQPVLPPTREQITARRVAAACLILFLVCLGLCVGWQGDDIGGALVLGIAAFAFLTIGTLAIGEC